MADHDRHATACHATQQDGRAIDDLDHRKARLELLAAVAMKGRPGLGTRDDRSEVGHHLTAIAYAQRKGVATAEEAFELVAQAIVEQDGLCPALPGTQHVAIGEATASRKAVEIGQINAARLQVGHMHVHRREARALEGRGHLELRIDPLLT